MQFLVKTAADLLQSFAEDGDHLYSFGTPASGRLHYFMGLSGSRESATDTYFIMAVVPDVIFEKWYSTDNGEKLYKEKRHAVVGCIELQISPFNPKEMWLKYISVDPTYQKQGIASKLIDMLAEQLPLIFKERNVQTLTRSRPSDLGKCITAKISNALTVPWTQSTGF